MTKFKKLFLAIFLVTSLSNFTSQAMEQTDEDDAEQIQAKWSEDENYLYIIINGVVWKYGPFNDANDSDKDEEKPGT